MKTSIWVGALALVCSQAALAQFFNPCAACGGTKVDKPGLILSGKTVCASRASEQWAEYHDPTTGALIEYAGGKLEPVGRWSSDPTSVTYDYGTGGRYTWALCKASASTYNFCQGTNVVSGATLKPGQTSCP